jgi:hypothetical protein
MAVSILIFNWRLWFSSVKISWSTCLFARPAPVLRTEPSYAPAARRPEEPSCSAPAARRRWWSTGHLLDAAEEHGQCDAETPSNRASAETETPSMSSVRTRVTVACGGSEAGGPPIRCSPCVLSVSYPVNFHQDIMQIVRASEHFSIWQAC